MTGIGTEAAETGSLRLPVTRDRPVRRARGDRLPVRDAVVLGVIAFLACAAFSGVPSVWYDEAATVASSQRSLGQLWTMVGTVDAVHALYYLGIHAWFDLVGYTPFTLRLPSAVAAGLTAALTVLLTARLAGSRLPARVAGLAAGIALVALPRFVWAGAEGRSYSLTATLAVGLTLLLIEALRADHPGSGRTRTLLWAAYGAVALLSVATFVYLAVLVAAHAVTVLWLLVERRVGRRSAVGFGVAAGGAALLSLPLVVEIVSQTGQIAWIGRTYSPTADSVITAQWLPDTAVTAWLFWPLVIAGLAVAARDRVTSRALPVLLPALVVPTAGLLLVSTLVTPLYSPRYLTFGIPIAAALIGLAVSWAWSAGRRARAAGLAALVGLLLLGAPAWWAQRQPEAKQTSSWAEVADIIASTRAEYTDPELPPAPGAEAVVFGRVAGHPNATSRVIAYSYPEAFRGLDDVTLDVPYQENAGLWETHSPLEPGELVDARDVWLVVSDRSDYSEAESAILAAGFTVDEVWHPTDVWLKHYVRTS